MLEKSLQLYPLPGVEALLAHAKTKKNSPSNSSETNNNNSSSTNSNRETSNGGSSSNQNTATSNGTSNRRSSSASAASSETQNGSDGRAYTQDQVLIVKKVLRAKEGGRGAHYRVLDIPSTATESDIKKAYRKLSLKVHPDKVRSL